MQILDGNVAWGLVSALGQFNNDQGQIEPKGSALFAFDRYCIA